MGELPKIVLPINNKNDSDENISMHSRHGPDIYDSDNDSNIDIDVEQGIVHQHKNKLIMPNLDDNHPWNYKIILFLRKVGTKTMGYRWMHDYEATHYGKMDNIFNIVEIIILSILGLLTSGQLITLIVTSGGEYKVAWIIITAFQLVLVLVYGIIKGIHDAEGYPELIFRNNYAALRFGGINLEIQNQLSLNLRDRDTDKVFLKNIIKTFNDIMYISPKLRRRTKQHYLKNSEEDDVFKQLDEDSTGNLKLVVSESTAELEKENKNQKEYQVERWLKHF